MVDLTRCFVQLERTSLWNLATTSKNYDAADIMDALMDFIVSLVNVLLCIDLVSLYTRLFENLLKFA